MNIKKQNKGISLIVLVITIIVIIIIAGAVILDLDNDNVMSKANEAKFKSNVGEYKSELAINKSSKYLESSSFKSSTFNAGPWNGIEASITGTVKEYIKSITAEDGANFAIQSGKLVYVGTDTVQKDWVTENGIPIGTGLGVNVIATTNSTVNGGLAAYSNPIVPKGFKAVNDVTTWPADWDEGLVIEDAVGNQFVWVPVDGKNVRYEKWCTTGTSNASTTNDSILSGAVIENTQVTTYGGFYIARYESMFDYNGGSIRAASKKSTNKATSSWTRDSLHTGYLFNYVNYTDAKAYSENMAASYSYDASKVKSSLVTGTQWDTAMKWIQNATINVVTDSRAWGNYSDSIAPANVGNCALQISGYNNNWRAKNIYDLAGNTWDWTNEIYSSQCVNRGGSCNYNGDIKPAAYRGSNDIGYGNYNLSFRVVLYIL